MATQPPTSQFSSADMPIDRSGLEGSPPSSNSDAVFSDHDPPTPTLEAGAVLAGGMAADRITHPQPHEAIAHPAVLTRRKNYWEDYQQIYNHGLELTERNQLREAITNFDRAIELQPDFALAWIAKGNALLKLRRTDEAHQHFQRATELQTAAQPEVASPQADRRGASGSEATVPPGYVALYNQGVALYETQQFDDALLTLQQAIDLQPDRPDAWRAMAQVLQRVGRTEDAQASIERAKALGKALTPVRDQP